MVEGDERSRVWASSERVVFEIVGREGGPIARMLAGKNEVVEKGRKQSHTVEKGPMRGLA